MCCNNHRVPDTHDIAVLIADPPPAPPQYAKVVEVQPLLKGMRVLRGVPDAAELVVHLGKTSA
jgi:hypothetical protein